MFNFDFNMNNMFHGMFGKVDKGMCAMSMSGNIAVRTSNGFKSYDIDKKRLTNVTNLCFDASDLFFVMPTSKVQIGDVILVKGADGKPHPKCVLRFNDDDKSIKCIDYETSEIKEIVPERHVFLGSTYFYGKIVSLFGKGSLKGKGAMGKMLQLMVMKSFMGNGNSDSMGGLGQMLMMQQLLGNGNAGNGLDFTNMFNLDFGTDASWGGDEDVDEDEDNEDADEEDKKPASKKKSNKKSK
jgi:hypothetical protein